MHLMDIDEIHQLFFEQIILNIIFPYKYEVFILRDINLVFLQYYQNTIHIHNYGYILTFLLFVCCILHYYNFKFSLEDTQHCIIWYFVQKITHKTMWNNIFHTFKSNWDPLSRFDGSPTSSYKSGDSFTYLLQIFLKTLRIQLCPYFNAIISTTNKY